MRDNCQRFFSLSRILGAVSFVGVHLITLNGFRTVW